jgi:hypothetical protein
MLESGMQVYATEAGGAPELRRFFPSQLRPFPPRGEVEPGKLDDPEVTGYDGEFNWTTIAGRYLEAVSVATMSRRPEDG